jgi:hypothetical protein
MQNDMVDEQTKFGGLLTEIGKAKSSRFLSKKMSWDITDMLIGDANGTDPIPSLDQNKLINQRYQGRLNRLYASPENPGVVIAEIALPEQVGGWWIRELALKDSDGDFIAVANCAPSFKPILAQGSGRSQIIRMHVAFSNTTHINLDIDSAALASRSFVYDYAAKKDHTHPARGIPGTYVFPVGGKIPKWSLRCPTRPTIISRKQYGDLFESITTHAVVSTALSSIFLNMQIPYDGLKVGDPVCGSGIQSGTTIVKVERRQITLSKLTMGPLNNSKIWAAPWGVGDGETTFGMPWFAADTGIVQANGNPATSTAGSVGLHAHTLNINSGGQSANHVHAVGDPGHSHIIQGNSGSGNSGGGDTMNFNNSPRNNPTSAATTGIWLGANNVDHTHNVRGNTDNAGSPLNYPAGVRTSICVWY